MLAQLPPLSWCRVGCPLNSSFDVLGRRRGANADDRRLRKGALFMSAFYPQSAEGRQGRCGVPPADGRPHRGTRTTRRRGRPGWRSTTPCALGESRTMDPSVGWVRSRYRPASRTETAIRWSCRGTRTFLAGAILGSTGKIYPDSAHGLLFQRHTEFGDDMLALLSEWSPTSPGPGGRSWPSRTTSFK